ncbi:MAG TPA: DUF3891 family protein [Tepidisphaeraceae bacterium]|jgi:hypothetical protein
MIRRDAGTHFLLITQHDHALFSGELARRLGNACFAAPSPYEITVEGIAHHDCGWPLHDDNPTLNTNGLPLHVFEAPAALAVQVWGASVARAMNLGDYQGLLVSLHVLGLSGWAMQHMTSPSRQDLFDLNKFQHRQVEIQEDLRKRLGMRTDLPLRFGLAQLDTSETDDQLLYNFRLLTAMDRVSLALCCGTNLFPAMADVHPRPGQPPVKVDVGMSDPATMTLDPWPFDQPSISVEVPARRVRKEPFGSVEEFQKIYRSAAVEPLVLTVRCA